MSYDKFSILPRQDMPRMYCKASETVRYGMLWRSSNS